MSPAESFRRLTPDQQRQVHLRLCEDALGVWVVYADAHAPIRYADSVVGMRHELDIHLPHDALQSARTASDLADVEIRYREPTSALQDDDLEFPDAVEFAYYAIYNCFLRHACSRNIDAWLIVSQALASMGDAEASARKLTAVLAAVN